MKGFQELKMGLLMLAVIFGSAICLRAQQTALNVMPKPETSISKEVISDEPKLTDREKMLLERIEKLEKRLTEVESRGDKNVSEQTAVPPVEAPVQPVKTTEPVQITEDDRGVLDFYRDTTINFAVDGYYTYNFNRPYNRLNLLRAYDVSSNSFSLNQASVVIENAPNVEKGRRFGFRLDLQYGQATETLQGSPNNELRPNTYRPVWQGYGTYVAPVGKGLTVDFGKFASSLGYETNYTKDNFNYSRSYFFNYLPYYHFGVRAAYPVTDKLTATLLAC